VDDLPAALTAYETAARLDPANWRALKGAGMVLDRMGRPSEAAAAYKRSREAQRR
jgi:Flp pilus assembly protein TadD